MPRSRPFPVHQLVEDHFQGAPCCLSRIEQLQRAAGGVAWILPRLLAVTQALVVHHREIALVDVRLATHRRGNGLTQSEWERADGAQILGDVFADAAVATCGAEGESSLLIGELDADPVDL